jgi:hypothetical protein
MEVPDRQDQNLGVTGEKLHVHDIDRVPLRKCNYECTTQWLRTNSCTRVLHISSPVNDEMGVR